jgi:hypothetical protein
VIEAPPRDFAASAAKSQKKHTIIGGAAANDGMNPPFPVQQIISCLSSQASVSLHLSNNRLSLEKNSHQYSQVSGFHRHRRRHPLSGVSPPK